MQTATTQNPTTGEFEWTCPDCGQTISNENAIIVGFDRGLHSCPR